jgi:hypothetical protein
MLRGGMVYMACAAVACAPVTTTVHVDEHIDSKRDDVSAPLRSTPSAAVTVAETTLAVRVVETDMCRVHTVESVSRVKRTHRKVSDGIVTLEFLGAIALGGAGGFALIDPSDTESTVRPITSLNNSSTFAVGASAAAVSALLFIVGIVDSTRGGDSKRKLPAVNRDLSDARERACGERPAAGRQLVVVAGDRRAPLAATDSSGMTTATWDSLSSALFEGPSPPDRGELHLGDANGPLLGQVELAKPRGAAIERAWATATATGTARAAAEFAARFPGAHATDVQAKVAAMGDTELDNLVGAALDHGDFAGARALIAEWAKLVPTSDRRTVREATLADREREAKIVELATGIDAALALGGDQIDTALVTAADLTGKLAAVAPADPRTMVEQAKVATARKQRQTQLLDAARAAENASKLDDALRLADVAVTTLPDDRKATKQRDDLRVRVARHYVADARAATRANDFPAADDALARAEALAKGDRDVVSARAALVAAQAAAEAAIASAADRERVKAAREQREAELKAARDAERQRAEAERAKVQADHEAAAQRAEAERVARDDQRRRDEQAAHDAAEAARKQRASDAQAARDAAAAVRIQHDAEAQAARVAADAARKQREAAAVRPGSPAAAHDKATPPPSVATAPAPARLDARGARLARAFTGVWAATGRSNEGRVLMLLDARPGGSGSITIEADSGRALGRQAVGWRVARGAVVLSGGTLVGRAIVRGDDMKWNGFAWRRVRAHTVLSAPGY